MSTLSKPAERLLIVEKQVNYTQLLVKQVMIAGFHPVVAVTGEGGLRKALEFHPRLVLLELDLTDMSGLDFVRHMKEHQRLQSIPIVAMSIIAQAKDAALQAGCADFLLKPIKMIDLVARIRRCLRSEPETKPPAPALRLFRHHP